jgi:dTDP-4-amino-4,6-dideoxygalactose transaminase
MIYVTKTFLPPKKEYQELLDCVWESGWLTNRGVLVLELEKQLAGYLKVPHIICTTNGTLPLQIAIKTLELTGEIITTPFSYVATTSSIVWEGCKPVFVDIHPEYLTIDETKIEAAITPKTSAILATHVFGNPCDVEVIEKIAEKHDLKVIYDAAHGFGVSFKGQSLLNYGDVSTCSFHATKVFHTGEGGAMIAADDQVHKALFEHHNFGHNGPEAFNSVGINAKMSELQAAMGLAVFPYFKDIVVQRKLVVEQYDRTFKAVASLQLLKIREKTHWNYCYYPIIFETETQLLKTKNALEADAIKPRRYFYPSLDNLPYVEETICEVSKSIASRVLCLPLYMGLKSADVHRIINITIKSLC